MKKAILLILVLALGLATVSLGAGDTWTAKSPMPTARSFLSASAVDGKIYAIGGTGGTSVVEEYDPATDTWTKKASLPTARQWLSTSVVDRNIYAIGGAPNNYGLSTVEAYDPVTDIWTRNADIEEGHKSTVLCHLANISYRIGGRKLVFDGKKETIIGDEEAKRLVKRTYRKPYVIPEIV